MKKVTISLYSFSELSEQAKNKAINEHRNVELSNMKISDFMSGEPEHDTPEDLQKTFDSEYLYLFYNDEPIIENIEANDYLFFASGKLANCITYTGGEKIGITELKLHGDICTF